MNQRTYRNWLAVGFGGIVLGVWALAVALQPADGDLARVGGYAENGFHWRTPQTVFPKNLFSITRDLKDYDRHYDVVVLGDSFSCDQEPRMFGWQNYFIAETGLSMIVFDTRRFWPQEIIESPGFKKFPPRVFVFESVERYLHGRTAYFAGVESEPSSLDKGLWKPPATRPLRPALRELTPSFSSSFDPGHVLGHLNTAVRRLLGLNIQVLKFPLKTGELFTSKNNRELLVYFDESQKRELLPPDMEKLRAGLRVFRDKVERNGYTRFVVLIAPDKSSLYAPFLADSAQATANLIAEAAADPSLPVVRTDKIFNAALATPDLYLPSDSHWSSRGHRLAAEGLIDFLGLGSEAP